MGILQTLFSPRAPNQPVGEQNTFNNENNAALGVAWGVFGDTNETPPYSIGEIQKFVRSPQVYNAELRQLARWMYYSNGTVSTAIDYLRAIYTLDCVISGKKDSSKNKMQQTLNDIRYRQVIRDGILHDANDGMYIAYFDSTPKIKFDAGNLTDVDIVNITELNSGENAMVTPLPVEYCKLIGRCNSSYVVAFDLNFFRGLSENDRKSKLKMFPKEITDAWMKYDNGQSARQWITLNHNRTIVSKIKSEVTDPYGVPFAVAALNDAEYAQYFVNTKRHILDSVNNQVIYETFPEGQEKGRSGLSDRQQKAQHDTIKAALMNRNSVNGISFFSLASGTKMDTIKTNTELLDEKNETAIVDSVNKSIGFSASALDGSSTGTYATAVTNLELVASNVYTWIEEIVCELNKCINYAVISDSKNPARFYILPTTFVNRDKQVKYMKDLYTSGKGSLTAWIASTGFNPEVYLDLMNHEIEADFENKYPVHRTSFTTSGNDEGGRPSDSDSLNPNTIKSQNSGGNTSPEVK